MNRIPLNRSLAVLLLVPLFAFAGPGDPPKNYDEVHRADGSYRLHYEGIGQVYEKIPAKRKKELLVEGEKLFEGDNPLNLLPRVLTEDEMATLEAGVKQRATALKLFFQDHYSGKKSYLKENVLPRDFVDQIIARHGEQSWEGKIPDSALSWLYGPDILRLPDGSFAVVEDNFGYLGGLGDLERAPDALLKLVPEYQRYLEVPNPLAFYQKLANRYHARAEKFGGKAVLLTYRPSEFDDNEGFRLRDLMDRFGVESVYFNSLASPDGRTAKYLEVRENGVYLKTKVGGKTKSEKVGYLFIQGHMDDMDSLSEGARRGRLIKVAEGYLEHMGEKADARVVKMMHENALGNPFTIGEAETLLKEAVGAAGYKEPYLTVGKGGVPGLFDAIHSGKVGANYTPGLGFVEDKEFYTAVPDLIRFYLHEEPKLGNLSTESFRKFADGKAVFDQTVFDRVFADFDQYVVKGVAGMGGKEVWIGKKMAKAEIEELKAKVRESPSLFIVQEYKPLSVMDGNLVDLRLIADVGPKLGDVATAPFPWGRASPLSGSGKVNISSGGSETAVFVRKNASMDCETLFH
ncbi:MAG: circularly permuted type 2 ATP-grasp protein [Bdellovibrionales bacterium]|nr:circularly permuted type 2 ATP-grasp protein [Bdellovibrionales bacterium]